MSAIGYWNDKMAWDRADGKAKRNPSLSYSNTYKAWRLARLDGHLAYTILNGDDLPTTTAAWDVYKNGVAPAPKIVIHKSDPRSCPNVVFVLGGPGAGKGTMCELAMIQLGWQHLSAGDLLRAERKEGGKNAALIEEYITAGKLVPDTITVGLLKKAMEEHIAIAGANNFLVDGFPRSLGNWSAWQEVFGKEAAMPTMLFFECPLPVLEERILARAEWSGRSDDNVEALRKRFTTYKEETMPIVDVFRSAGKVVDVDSSKPRPEVWDLVKEKLAPWSDSTLAVQALAEKSECLLGIRPWPKKAKTDA